MPLPQMRMKLADFDGSQIALTVLSLGGLEPEADTAGLLQVVGCLGDITLVVLGPLVADFVEDDAAVVVVVGVLRKDNHGEGLAVDFGNVELDDGEFLAGDILGLELGAVGHEVGESSDGLGNCLEIDSHGNNSFQCIISTGGCLVD